MCSVRKIKKIMKKSSNLISVICKDHEVFCAQESYYRIYHKYGVGFAITYGSHNGYMAGVEFCFIPYNSIVRIDRVKE